MAASFLLVPIHLDALYLLQDRTVIEPLADFSRLDGSSIPYLSEVLLSQPFKDRRFLLLAGIHLHWALPDALTHGRRQKNTVNEPIVFPAVPNRWLVTRSRVGGSDQKQWVVESDYLYPPGDDANQLGRVTYPYRVGDGDPTYRYLGRNLPLASWEAGSEGDYLDKLTAVGYGEVTFAAFYPNCHSVFGFHDPELPADLNGLRYEVIGWYNNLTQEPLQGIATLKELQDTHRWTVDEAQLNGGFPQRIACYAQITFGAAADPSPLPEKKKIPLAIGNTSTEALSAYLAVSKAVPQSGGNGEQARRRLEDQLEALHLADRMEGRQIDIGAKFQEARHEKEFQVVPGGTLWVIRAESAVPMPAAAPDSPLQKQAPLPAALAGQLDQVNRLQEAYDRDSAELESLRQQLFTDWYKYMILSYPSPSDVPDAHITEDVARRFIRDSELPALHKRIEGNQSRALECQSAVNALAQAVVELQLLPVDDPDVWKALQPLLEQRLGKDRLTTVREEDRAGIIAGINEAFNRPYVIFRNAVPDASQLDLGPEAQSLRPEMESTTPLPSMDKVYRFNRLVVEAICPALPKMPFYVLKPVPAPRYYQPNEPVVLLVSDGDPEETVKPTPRHGQDGRQRDDGLLDCAIIALDQPIERSFDDILAFVNKPAPDDQVLPPIGYQTWTQQPWHPFLLEWEVKLQPVQAWSLPVVGDDEGRAYDPNGITKFHELGQNAVDLVPLPDMVGALAEPETYTYIGRSILTPHAKTQLGKQVEAFVEKQLLGAYFEDQKIPATERSNDYFDEHLEDILEWYAALAPDKKPDQSGTLDEILRVYAFASGPDFHVLAQSLSGFNAALLGCKQTLQLPIEEPWGFPDHQMFTGDVAEAVGDSTRVAPAPQNDFNPIRTGTLRLNRLNLIDTFGQWLELDLSDGLITTDTMSRADGQVVALPPRLAQPARLNFRWLAANATTNDEFTDEEDAEAGPDATESNSHPDTTPVCGWLLPNLLDSSLMVYDAAGQALGSLGRNGQWFAAPGLPRLSLAELPGQLQKVVEYVSTRGENYAQDFLTAIENALENIAPDQTANHSALALLMGRPIAVARAVVNLELQGLPAVDHTWEAFERDIKAPDQPRTTAGFTAVTFPIRIGEFEQLNDGLIGYWVEGADGALGDDFFAPQTVSSEAMAILDPHIKVHQDGQPVNLSQSLDSPPQILTMLLDPLGSVHATTGILPTKAIHIPAEHYTDALRKLEITFLSAPILTDRGQINLPLPDEAGFVWSWLEREAGRWSLWPIGAPNVQATFTAQELREGWLKLAPAGDGAA